MYDPHPCSHLCAAQFHQIDKSSDSYTQYRKQPHQYTKFESKLDTRSGKKDKMNECWNGWNCVWIHFVKEIK